MAHITYYKMNNKVLEAWMKDHLISPTSLAEILKLPYQTVHRWVKSGVPLSEGEKVHDLIIKWEQECKSLYQWEETFEGTRTPTPPKTPKRSGYDLDENGRRYWAMKSWPRDEVGDEERSEMQRIEEEFAACGADLGAYE